MKIINHYIFKTVFFTVLIVLSVLCVLAMLSEIIDGLGSISGNYNFTEVLIFAGLKVPENIYHFMPFAALVGSLIGLGSLASSSELTAIRAAGASLLQITFAVLKPVVVLIIATLLLAEYVVPLTDQYAETRRSEKLGQVNSALSSRDGLWNREQNEFMHFNRVQANGQLEGVTRYRFDENNQLISSSFAREAQYMGQYWLEKDVVETTLAQKITRQTAFESRRWENQLSPELLTILVQDTNNLAISRLFNYINYLQRQAIDSAQYQLSFWEKVLQPFAIISLVLIAISFVFGSLREVTMGYRIFVGVIVGISFQMTQRLLGPTSLVYEFPPIIAVAIPILVCFLLGLFLLIQKR